ncbi:MAG: EpsI family protein [Alphaproteobacteria bacterium]|nr:EpsI family protein [Alphaproteobacteria bacterium]
MRVDGTLLLRAGAIALLMLGALGATAAITPQSRALSADRVAALGEMLPMAFGDWRQAEDLTVVLPDPRVQRMVETLYTETVARTYENAEGRQIMLVLAYGEDQSAQLQLHRPETCYRAQGFTVRETGRPALAIGGGVLPVKQLLTERPLRREPVTYWMRVGGSVVTGVADRQWAKLSAGLSGTVPDGILVRVSSLSSDADQAFALQADFIRELLLALDPAGRRLLLGTQAERVEPPTRAVEG